MPKPRAVPRSPSWTVWLKRRRNKTRIQLLEADWPGLKKASEHIAEWLERSLGDQQRAAAALDRILDMGWTAYLNARSQPSSKDSDRLIAFVGAVCEALRAELLSVGNEVEDIRKRIQSALPPAYGRILERSSATSPTVDNLEAKLPGTKPTVH
ncbi:hypothetical protein [Methylocaldum szegediense]|jgi:hypothetical protein|uniref:hypothetical protein n=1 Tax=Methylocaldum szegediense TaxID=73780 RepID=UPI0004191CE5|nr:hypothetical protein [Methylocaldum szegediense]